MQLLSLGEITSFHLSEFRVPMTWPKSVNWLLSWDYLPSYAR